MLVRNGSKTQTSSEMEITKTLYVADREEWRAWLKRNYESETEIWLIYYKKHTGQPSVSYNDAVEEALCFGWIDGIVKRIDDEKYSQRFTPRKAKSNWSELNKRRVAKLIGEGKMTQVGLAKISFPVEENSQTEKQTLTIPDYIRRALTANKIAWRNFNNLAPSYQENYINWIMAAKKEERRSKRLQEAIQLLEQNKKLGMK